MNAEVAAEFINRLTTDETKQMIGEFGAEEFGKPLFTPLYSPACAEPPFNCTCTGEATG